MAARWGGHHGGQQRRKCEQQAGTVDLCSFQGPISANFLPGSCRSGRAPLLPPHQKKTHSIDVSPSNDAIHVRCFFFSLCVVDVISLHAVKSPALPPSCRSMMVYVLQDLPSTFTIQANLLPSLQTASADLRPSAVTVFPSCRDPEFIAVLLPLHIGEPLPVNPVASVLLFDLCVLRLG